MNSVVPTNEPGKWLNKQQLIREEKPTVAGILLFADEPQAVLPKQSGVKIYRYKTRGEPTRDSLAGMPETVEGCIYHQIKNAVEGTMSIIDGISVLTADGLVKAEYPFETLHEIITNAILHRDYSIMDDVHIRIFDNRIEIQSP
jgi:ATP-dependent DNA helicase RecG